MRTLLRYASMAKTFLKINIQCGLEYPTYLIGWLLSNPLQFLFGIITIKVVVNNFHALAGWSFEQITFLYGLAIISHGLSIILFIQTWGMDYMVTQGEFDRMLVRPLNVFFQFCFMDFNFIGFTDLIPGIVVFAYGCAASGFHFTLVNIFRLLLVIVGATALRGGIYTFTGALAFWIKRTRRMVDVYLQLYDYTTKYPMSMFPGVIQALFTFALPIGFVSFYPSSEFFGLSTAFSLTGDLCLYTFLIGVGVYALGMAVFNRGLRRYESSGS